MMRHRDAWAEKATAPSQEQYLAELAEEEAEEEAKAVADETEKRRIVTTGDDAAKEVLVVVSKLKGYVKARSGMSTSDGVVDVLSQHLRKLCDQAIENATTAGRKTVMDRDFEAVLRAASRGQ
jgi:histone H3/H4